ncbi:MAG: molybdopterin-dependent oxidoreductase, partial [Desulfuromonadales bacterium]|nr:molybdopterin-dependent oxidoreductase [Desulfuromonadales bacterium]NIR33495.1 molybdopterin-dependent oxidoreductase [Desulfuromonadales bacterium]NIS39668.1 molybdopterin-dependent oxidoreductase [Desulfuromonadales bacterium]
ELPFAASHLPLPPGQLPAALDAIATGDFSGFGRRETQSLEGIAERLRQAERPVLVGGGDLLGPFGTDRLLAAARALSGSGRPVGTMTLLPGPNSLGLALVAGAGPDFSDVLQAIEENRIRALVCLEADPLGEAADPHRSRTLLSRLETLVVVDALPTAAARQADIFLPAAAPAEAAGTYVNNEGRLLPFTTVIAPGVPISVTGHGDHPPRTFDKDTPGSEPLPDWAILDALRGEHRSLEAIR